MSKHTPGPWLWDAGLVPPDGPDRYASIYPDDDSELIIASFNDQIPAGRANARLIAAAPEMYEALKAFMSFYDKAMEGASPGFDEARGCDHVLFGMNDARLMIGHFWDARDAIAKAEGRT